MRIKLSKLRNLINEALNESEGAPGLFVSVRDTNIDLSTVVNPSGLAALLDDLLGTSPDNRAAADHIVQGVLQSIDKSLNEIVEQSDVNPDNSFGVPSLSPDYASSMQDD
jgi:hypothetical protein